MAYRNIFISSSAKLSIKNNQLVIKTQEELTIPLEDISTILIENLQGITTNSVLSRCSEEGILVYVCNEKYLPCGVLTGFNTHSRKTQMLQSQIDIPTPLKKHIWQKIVQQKILNQAEVLKLVGTDGYDELHSIFRKVRTNDEDNMEAVAAAKYFKHLFGSQFSRGQSNIINARLNYGYAIIRGLICRSLVVYGLEPALGVHHKSQLNAFNLADDLIEVFRPMVDLCVFQMVSADGIIPADELTTKDKQILYNLVNCDIMLNNKKYALAYAVEKYVQSFQSSILEHKNNLLPCSVIPLKQHEYE